MPSIRILALFLFVIAYVQGDLYMHNPRGSNNRLAENGRDRANNNRLFDSQNNNRGGYNVGGINANNNGEGIMEYFEKSQLPVEWTNQHSCGDQNNDCDIIIQYACGPNLRDGLQTGNTPEVKASDTNPNNGLHEPYHYYRHCRFRTRNKGLFTSDQNLGEAATSTRQDNQGGRSGFECNEERDYYPYWHPTMWRDAGILTNDVDRCNYYRSESQNVKSRFFCKVSESFLETSGNNPPKNEYIPITKEECDQFEEGTWTEVEAFGIDPPACIESRKTRDNHLGNSLDGQTPNFNWTIPGLDEANISEDDYCVLRMRYNISTGEYGRDNTFSESNNEDDDDEGPDVWTRQNLDQQEGKQRGYRLEGNPEIDIFDSEFKLALAINTDQYGRTFQDRSHVFKIRKRPAQHEGKTIFNLNVRGKRGNIVQTYPATEYDFVPNTIRAQPNSLIHFQVTGSDTNPNNNDGQGKAGSDRSNFILQTAQKFPEGSSSKTFFGQYGTSYPEKLADANFIGMSVKSKKELALVGSANGDELDDASPYYDHPLQTITGAGTYHYMCTRNNNFSNRSQKGRIVVLDFVEDSKTIDKQGGTISSSVINSDVKIEFPANAIKQNTFFTLSEFRPNSQKAITSVTKPAVEDSKFISNVVVLSPQESFNGGLVKITMKLDEVASGLNFNELHQHIPGQGWSKIELTEGQIKEDGTITFDASAGGSFVFLEVFDRAQQTAIIAGSVAGVIIFIMLLIVIFYCCCSTKGKALFQEKV